MDPNDQRVENLRVNIESLRSSVTELYAVVHEQHLRTEEVVEAARRDGENIATLARIAESHERRLTRLEGEEQ
ncbi:MAG TPA: hypothetical protein VEV85_16110 [Bryobacteraceae bacterium]|nr:hypothetical protein [Bryobacteraceae bacterium]